MKKRNPPDDISLFKEAVKNVKPLQHDKIFFEKPKTKVKSKIKLLPELPLNPPTIPLTETNLQEVTATTTLFYQRHQLNPGILKLFQRGQMQLDATLDLHQLTVAEARNVLIHFLTECKLTRKKYVLIIHGKGRGAYTQTAKLKSYVNHWLPQFDNVLAFCSAQPKHGGTGAVYVLLKKLR